MRRFSIFFLTVSLLSCSSTPTAPSKSAAKETSPAPLTWEQAKDRKARLENVRYFLSVKLNAQDEIFSGINKISFYLKDAGRPLRLDFYEGSVSLIKVNGAEIPTSYKSSYWIDLPADRLKVGENIVEVHYDGAFNRNGEGLHRFVDPETKEVFTYTHFEPYHANRVFPCFDQPDLRASFTLEAEVPESWKVISTTRETQVTSAGKGRKLWQFPESQKIATYLFSLHAGPYQVWESKFEDIPLRLFARPSMAKYVRAQEWFKWTKEGLGFYDEFFAFKYPFKKYDQIFVPEGNGAMENVASVTFQEGFLHRSEPSRAVRRADVSVLLHEMAHMWFGDLVTMSWWNDLWLNETFATLMSAISEEKATEFKESWQHFSYISKINSYVADSHMTTHPIEAPVNDTLEAVANFDAITYGKGASVMKQLRHYIGAKEFELGVQKYMHDHAFSNTHLTDFIDALQSQTKKDLSVWAEAWLKQSGHESLKVDWTCEGAKLPRIHLQTSSEPPVTHFRPQKLDFAFYKANSAKLVAPKVISVDITQADQVVEGPWDCPAMIYPNYEDYGYLQVLLDRKSLDFATANLDRIANDQMRELLWNDLWAMVRAGQMPLKNYVAVLDHSLSKEQNQLVLSQIVDTVFQSIYYWPQVPDASLKARGDFVSRMENEFKHRLNASRAGSDDQKFWYDQFVLLARTPAALEELKNWAAAKNLPKGFTVDADRRWVLLKQIARFSPETAGPFIEKAKQLDPSDRGRRGAMAADAVQPNIEVKKRWIADLIDPKKTDLPMYNAIAVESSLFPLEQKDLAKNFDATLYAYFKANAKSSERYVMQMALRLSPVDCEPVRSQKLKDFIDHTELQRVIGKALKDNWQEDQRCIMVRAKSEL